ncbi:hypothetical protein AYO40_00785 [Planctomycetaceae bacterium SCGC AG-212-D15]|nr:hypothetical protein AYO40_00785 [Planctomycetaceae bacterium SCGC AG-212-D15]
MAQKSISCPSKKLDTRIARMNPGLRQKVKEARALLNHNCADTLRTLHQVGAIAAELQDTKKHGVRALGRLANAIGVSKTTLLNYAAVAGEWHINEIRELIKHKGLYGRPVSFEHLVKVANLLSGSDRDALIEDVLSEGLPASEIRTRSYDIRHRSERIEAARKRRKGYKIRCQGHRHMIKLNRKGQLALLDHGHDDISKWTMWAELGGTGCECVSALLAWRQHCTDVRRPDELPDEMTYFAEKARNKGRRRRKAQQRLFDNLLRPLVERPSWLSRFVGIQLRTLRPDLSAIITPRTSRPETWGGDFPWTDAYWLILSYGSDSTGFCREMGPVPITPYWVKDVFQRGLGIVDGALTLGVDGPTVNAHGDIEYDLCQVQPLPLPMSPYGRMNVSSRHLKVSQGQTGGWTVIDRGETLIGGSVSF